MPRPPKKPPNRSDGLWEVKRSFYKITGDKKRKSFYSSISYNDAVEKADEYGAMLRANILVGDSYISRETTFKEWAETWLEKYKEGKVKESTYLESYKRTVDSYLVPYFGKRMLTNIQPADIEEFVNTKSYIYSESVMHKMRLCMNAIFNTAIDNNLCRSNPAKNVMFTSHIESEEKRTYTQKEVDKIYKFCANHKTGIYIRILLELGLRCSELCGLKWSDFNFTKKQVHIQRAITEVKNVSFIGKTKNKASNRIIPLSTKMVKIIKQLNLKPDEYLLHTSTDKPMNPAYFSKSYYNKFMVDLISAHKELESLTPHELRHTCGTLLYAKTKDIYAVSKYLGHANISITTKLYVHDSPELLRSNLGIK